MVVNKIFNWLIVYIFLEMSNLSKVAILFSIELIGEKFFNRLLLINSLYQ